MLIRHLACSFLIAMAATASQAQTFTFGLWGDMPYQKAGDATKMPALIKSINASDIAFSIYDGDIKDGSSKCTDDVYTQAIDMFSQVKKPVVYIPGDNEWTDCHRTNNGGYDPIERLTHLRKVMIPTTRSLGKTTLALTRQAELGQKFVENARMIHKGIQFVTLNIPGSNNNRVMSDKECMHKSARTLQQCEQGNAEYLERDAANIEWIRSAFAQARERQLKGLVMVFQGDPGFDLPETEDLDESKAPDVSGYRQFLAAVVEETEKYAGQVLLVHGDTHFFKMDKPLYSPTRVLHNLTRLQTFGSPSIHWVKVKVDVRSQSVFLVEPVMVKN